MDLQITDMAIGPDTAKPSAEDRLYSEPAQSIMASKTQIVNIAMARIGASKQLANVDTDTSREAIMARARSSMTMKFVLRDFPWPWATSYADLAVVAGSTTTRANRDWQYSYRYPSDCLYVRRLVVDGIGQR